jgi:hypothetical protein
MAVKVNTDAHVIFQLTVFPLYSSGIMVMFLEERNFSELGYTQFASWKYANLSTTSSAGVRYTVGCHGPLIYSLQENSLNF